MKSCNRPWWQVFFEDPAAFTLGMFPTDAETDAEVCGLERMLELRPGERVADICCGAGRHLVRLAARGLRVIGLDRSRMMLGLARRAVAERGVRAPLVAGDMRSLPWRSGSFDVALCLFNSFGYLTDESDNLRTLEEMARSLRPGGRLLLDTRNRQFQILFAPYHMETAMPDGSPVVVSSRYDATAKRLNTLWRDPNDPSAIRHQASIRLYGMDELDAMMARCGLEKVATYGTYRGEAFEGFHRQLLYVARRV